MISNKRLAVNQLRRLNTMRRVIDGLADEWDEIDQCVMSEMLDLSRFGFDKCIEQLKAYVSGELE